MFANFAKTILSIWIDTFCKRWFKIEEDDLLGIHNYQNNYPVLKKFAKFHSNRSCISGVNVIQTILKKELYIATARDVCCTLRHTNVCEYDKFCDELTCPDWKNFNCCHSSHALSWCSSYSGVVVSPDVKFWASERGRPIVWNLLPVNVIFGVVFLLLIKFLTSDHAFQSAQCLHQIKKWTGPQERWTWPLDSMKTPVIGTRTYLGRLWMVSD